MANHHELPVSAGEARASAVIAGLVLVGVSGIELVLSGTPGLPYLATALFGVVLLIVCIVSSR